MLQLIRQTYAPPVFEDEERTRIAVLLNNILWAVILLGVLYALFALFVLNEFLPAVFSVSLVLIGLTTRWLMMRGNIRSASVILVSTFNFIIAAATIISGGASGGSYFGLLLPVVLGGVLLGRRGAMIFGGVNMLVGFVILLEQDNLPAPLISQNAISHFSSLFIYIFFITALLRASARGLDNLLESLRNTQRELIEKNEEMGKFAAGLEATIAARTVELDKLNLRNERRAKQFEAIAAISRVISQTQDLESLLPQVTDLISRQFGYYHAGIFLMDANNEYAVLIAANSAGGQKMLARNHKLKIGQTGIVGYVAGTRLPRIALDTGADAIYFNNPDLPDTRSELALPLVRKGSEIIGVLDVQSKEANAFSQEDVRTLTTLADQVSIAIENSRLFGEQERILRETQAVYSSNLREGWLRFTKTKNIAGIQRRNLKSSFLVEPLELPGSVEAMRSGSLYNKTAPDGSSTLALPIKVREQVVGVLNIKSEDNRAWTTDELDVVTAIVDRAALAIENARLLEESRRTAEREHVIGEISTKIGEGIQIEDILRIAVSELGARISGTQVTVEIGGGG